MPARGVPRTASTAAPLSPSRQPGVAVTPTAALPAAGAALDSEPLPRLPRSPHRWTESRALPQRLHPGDGSSPSSPRLRTQRRGSHRGVRTVAAPRAEGRELREV